MSLKRAEGGYELSADIARELTTPKRLGESEGHTFLHGANGGYVSGTIPTRRWYVVDGAGRVHPLREGWRQRFERIAFSPWRWRARRAKS